MENIQKDKTLVRFSSPDPNTNSIIVSRVLPDDSAEPIGKIFPDFGNGEDSVMYISVNNNGEMLFPATSDFVDLENKFEKYSKELVEESLAEEMKARADEYEKREAYILGIRYWKKREQQTISR
jgi:hypothetical protein